MVCPDGSGFDVVGLVMDDREGDSEGVREADLKDEKVPVGRGLPLMWRDLLPQVSSSASDPASDGEADLDEDDDARRCRCRAVSVSTSTSPELDCSGSNLSDPSSPESTADPSN